MGNIFKTIQYELYAINEQNNIFFKFLFDITVICIILYAAIYIYKILKLEISFFIRHLFSDKLFETHFLLYFNLSPNTHIILSFVMITVIYYFAACHYSVYSRPTKQGNCTHILNIKYWQYGLRTALPLEIVSSLKVCKNMR